MLLAHPGGGSSTPGVPTPRPRTTLGRLPRRARAPDPADRRLLLPADPAPAQPSAPAAGPRGIAGGRRRGHDQRRHLRHDRGHRRRRGHRDPGDRAGHPDPDASSGRLAAVRRGRCRRGRGRRDRRRGRPGAVSAEPVPAGGQSAPAPPVAEPEGITLEDVQKDEELSSFISAADRVMEGLGYTEHGFRHANLTARIAFNVLSRAGFDTHTANLACVAGYLHDVGNMISRFAHGQTGGVLVYQALRERVPSNELSRIAAPIANHEEDNGYAVSPVSAAVILADKSDVHRSRVRKSGQIEFDIHDRVNFAAEQSFLRVDSDAKTVSLELTIDTQISQVMEYFEIFLGRMQLCRLAAEVLNCKFKLLINGAELA